MHIYFLSLLNIHPPCHPPTHTNLDLINVRRNIHILKDLITFLCSMLLSLSNLPAAEQSCRIILCHLPAASVCSLQPDWGDDTPPAAPPPSPGPPPCTGSARTPGCQGQQVLWFIHHLFVKKKAMLNRMGALSLSLHPTSWLFLLIKKASTKKYASLIQIFIHLPYKWLVSLA